MANYRRIAFEQHGRECVVCGATEGLEVHHRDGDRTNNQSDNLLPLCNRHHSKLHRSGLNGWEDELKPVSERPQVDPSTTTFNFSIDRERWENWKGTVSRTKTLDTRIVELIEADKDGRIDADELED